MAQPLTARHREIAAALGPLLAERGLLLVGLDVIGDYLTEVNVTSPTCFREIQDQTGFDVAGHVPRRALEPRARMIGVLIVTHGAIGDARCSTSAAQILGSRPLQACDARRHGARTIPTTSCCARASCWSRSTPATAC